MFDKNNKFGFIVNNNNETGGVNTNDSKMIPIIFASDSYGNTTISPKDVDIKKLLDMGGYIHVIVDVGTSSIDIPLLFDKKNLLSYDSYEDMPVYIVKKMN